LRKTCGQRIIPQKIIRAFSSEVGTGSREENAVRKESGGALANVRFVATGFSWAHGIGGRSRGGEAR
jgi:hypothetical protein